MTIEEIISKKKDLNKQLIEALSTMSLSSNVKEIRKAIKENQEHCPHISQQFNSALINGCCPFCGKNMESK